MGWSDVSAAERAAYRPITGRLLEKYRGNDQVLRETIFCGRMAAEATLVVTNGVNEDTWTTLTTLRLFVPLFHTGGTTTLLYVANTVITNGNETMATTAKWRMKIGSDLSNEITHTHTGDTNPQNFVRDEFTFSPISLSLGAINDVEFQAKATVDESSVTLAGNHAPLHEGVISTV